MNLLESRENYSGSLYIILQSEASLLNLQGDLIGSFIKLYFRTTSFWNSTHLVSLDTEAKLNRLLLRRDSLSLSLRISMKSDYWSDVAYMCTSWAMGHTQIQKRHRGTLGVLIHCIGLCLHYISNYDPYGSLWVNHLTCNCCSGANNRELRLRRADAGWESAWCWKEQLCSANAFLKGRQDFSFNNRFFFPK